MDAQRLQLLESLYTQPTARPSILLEAGSIDHARVTNLDPSFTEAYFLSFYFILRRKHYIGKIGGPLSSY